MTKFVHGYQLTVKIQNGKIIKGLETVGLSINPVYESILLKENLGVEEKISSDFETTLSCSGKTALLGDGDTNSTHVDFETLREACANGDAVQFVYSRVTDTGVPAGTKAVSGTGKLSNWSENSGSEKTPADFSFDILAEKGTVKFVAA